MDRRRLGGFIQQIFSAWDEPAVQVPLELGRQVVYGAIGHARELGFEPHAGFGRAAGYLGTWDGECELTFGRDGKPMYISGPHDVGERIIRKLRRGLGDGNYDFVHMISAQAERRGAAAVRGPQAPGTVILSLDTRGGATDDG
jgi:hypothetical protein